MKAVFGKTVYTGRDTQSERYLLFDGDRIAGLSASLEGELLGRFDVLTPAFVDSHCHIGMARAGEPGSEDEANEKLESILANADALDSIQMDDSSFTDSVEAGVLYSCVVPGSGNILSGRSAVIRNYGKTTTEALIGRAGIKAAFGYNPMSTREWKGTRPYTRMGSLALLRKSLHDVRQKIEKKNRLKGEKAEDITFNAEEEILRSLLSGEERLRTHVHKTDDIASLIRIITEFGITSTVEHACDVHDIHIFKELARLGILVNYGPLDAFAYKVELKHENPKNVRLLIESGVKYGLMTDHPVILQKMLLHGLRWFLRFGLDRQQALEIITRCNAELLGIDDRLGTLEKGKWASFVGWNGDPFDLTRYPVTAFGEGKQLFTL